MNSSMNNLCGLLQRPRWKRILRTPLIAWRHYRIARQYGGVWPSIRIALAFARL